MDRGARHTAPRGPRQRWRLSRRFPVASTIVEPDRPAALDAPADASPPAAMIAASFPEATLLPAGRLRLAVAFLNH
jgi:hypothetical protein